MACQQTVNLPSLADMVSSILTRSTNFGDVMLIVQTHLVRKTEHGEEHCKCWLNVKPNVRVGSSVKLEDCDEWYTVVSQGHVQDSSLINQKWGLDLPKSQRLER